MFREPNGHLEIPTTDRERWLNFRIYYHHLWKVTLIQSRRLSRHTFEVGTWDCRIVGRCDFIYTRHRVTKLVHVG